MNYEHDIKTLLTIGENIVIEFKRAGNGPEHDTYESIEKMGRETTEKTTLQATLSSETTTLQTTLQGTALKIAQLMLSHPEIKIDEIASTVGLTRDGVNYQIRKLKKLVGLRHRARPRIGFSVRVVQVPADQAPRQGLHRRPVLQGAGRAIQQGDVRRRRPARLSAVPRQGVQQRTDAARGMTGVMTKRVNMKTKTTSMYSTAAAWGHAALPASCPRSLAEESIPSCSGQWDKYRAREMNLEDHAME